MAEAYEVEDRETHMVMFRLAESENDRTNVKLILQHLTHNTIKDEDVIKIIRLGKKNDKLVRPILIKLGNLTIKKKIFKNLYKMKSLREDLNSVGIGHDLTMEQRNELKKLIDEAKIKEAGCNDGFLYRVRGNVGRWKIVKFLRKKI